MQSMFRAERRSLSTAPPGETQLPHPSVTLSGAVTYLRRRVRPTFLAAAVVIGAACLIALLLAAGQAAAASGAAGRGGAGEPPHGAPGGTEPAGAAGPGETGGSGETGAAEETDSVPSTAITNEFLCEMSLPENPVPQTGDLLVTLPWGTDSGQVGRSMPEEGLARGPEGLAVAPDGHVTVLDSVNRRVVILSPQGEWVGAFPVPLSQPRFIAAGEEAVAVLDPDVDRCAITLDWSGVVTQLSPMPHLESPATGVFIADGSVWVETGHERCVSLDPRKNESREGRPLIPGQSTAWAKASHTPGADPHLAFQGLDECAADRSSKEASGARPAAQPSLRLSAHSRVDHLVGLAGDDRGATFVGMRLTRGGIAVTRIPSSQNQPRTALPATSTAPCDTILLPEPSGLDLGVPYTVSPDGRILRAEADDAGYSIWVHSFQSATGETGVTP